MLNDDIYTLNLRHLGEDGKLSEHPAGRFLVKQGRIHHLEDNYGILQRTLPEGDVDSYAHRVHQGMQNNPYLSIVSESEKNSGKVKDIPEADIPDPPEEKEPLTFEYQRGYSDPKLLQIMGNDASLDGAPISQEEAMSISQEVKNGVSTIRYQRQVPLRKAEKEPEPEDPSLLFEDAQVPGVQNKYAHKQWLETPKPGVYMALDGNSSKVINEDFGHQVGDLAIGAIGKSMLSAIEEMGLKDSSVFRDGDKWLVHMQSSADASLFARKLRAKLEEIPPISGSHALSLSVGIGMDEEMANKALRVAKAQKTHPETQQPIYEKGQEPMFCYSLLPGSEGSLVLTANNPMREPGMQEPAKPQVE